jgi:small subunit ribosomal protein S20
LANLKSSKKDIRRTLKRTELNSQKKSRIRTFAKNIVKSIKAGEVEKIDGLYRDYSSLLDKAAKTNLIHAKNADRKKSRMALFISKNKQSQASAQA